MQAIRIFLFLILFGLSIKPAYGNILLSCAHIFSGSKIDQRVVKEWVKYPGRQSNTRMGIEWEGAMPLETEKLTPLEEDALVGKKLNEFAAKVVDTLQSIDPTYAAKAHKNEFGWPYIEFAKDQFPNHIEFPIENFPVHGLYYPVEFSFPIFSKNSDFRMYDAVIRLAKDSGFILSKYAGKHFHLDAENMTSIEFLMFGELLEDLLPQIKKKWGIHKARDPYLGLYPIAFKEILLRNPSVPVGKLLKEIQFLEVTEPYFYRYNRLYKTLEIRVFNTSFDTVENREEAQFVKGLFDAFLQKEKWLMKSIEQRKLLRIEEVLDNTSLENFN